MTCAGLRFALLVGVTLVAGCAGSSGAPLTDVRGCTGGEADGDTHVEVGVSIAAADGCNTCVCLPDGMMACTHRVCAALARDGGDEAPSTVDAAARDAGEVDAPTDAGSTAAGHTDAGSPCVDDDLDGFYTCIDPRHPERPALIDCDDTRFYVQPGGLELADTPEDDDCDGSTEPPPSCGCGDGNDAPSLLAAMDLCGASVTSVTSAGDENQFASTADYFGDVTPREGACLGILSTGEALSDDLQVRHCANLTSCGFADPSPQQQHGGQQGSGRVYDLAQLHMKLDAPTNARGLQFDFMFLSSEWPEYLCKVYNDTFYGLVETKAVNDGAPTNIAFDAQGRAMTVNASFFEQPADWTTTLDQTPFGGVEADAQCPQPGELQYVQGCSTPAYCDDAAAVQRSGSGSGWLTASTPVMPGEHGIELTLSIHDESDAVYDSLVIIDHVRWTAYAPPLGATKQTP